MTVQNKLVRTIIAVCLTAVVFSGCFPTSDEKNSKDDNSSKEIISDKKVTQIKIIDDNASQKAYKELTDYLTDNHINYFSDSE